MLVWTNPPRASQSAGNRNGFSVRRDLHGPPTEQSPGMIGIGKPESDVKITLRVELGTKGILMIISVPPPIGDCLELVSPTIPVPVSHPGKLATLGNVKRVVLVSQSEDLIQARSKKLECRARLSPVDSGRNKDVSSPRSYRDPAIRQGNESTRLDDQTLGDGDFGYTVVGALPLGRSPPLPDLLAPDGVKEGKEPQEKFSAGLHSQRRIRIVPSSGKAR